jgi:hypothetical protein
LPIRNKSSIRAAPKHARSAWCDDGTRLSLRERHVLSFPPSNRAPLAGEPDPVYSVRLEPGTVKNLKLPPYSLKNARPIGRSAC